jgi:hypothetical protein
MAEPTLTLPPSLEFVNHPRPDLHIDFEIFEDVGCPPNEYGYRICNPESALAALDCDEIREPSDLLGALEPSYPIALCLVEPYRNTEEPGLANSRVIAEGKYFFNIGGVIPTYVRYVIFREGQFHLIKTEEELQSIFTPIQTPNEALSYALAVRNLSAYYDLEPNPGYQYFVDTIEDTYVEKEEDGFSAHLYYYEVFGCGPHLTCTVNLHITPEGGVQEIGKEAVWKDPNKDGLCVD